MAESGNLTALPTAVSLVRGRTGSSRQDETRQTLYRDIGMMPTPAVQGDVAGRGTETALGCTANRLGGTGTEPRRKAHMQKQRLLRTPLVAVLGFLAFLAVPAAAEAHNATTKAACVLENNVPTLQLTAVFDDFSGQVVSGTVDVDGVERFSGTVQVEWGYLGQPNVGSWTFKYATTPGLHTIQADFS